MAHAPKPETVVIVGAGVFGLSTALSLLSNPAYRRTKITVVDASPSLPNPSGSSVDTNRIVRSDYAYKHYSSLALDAQELWRDRRDEGWGGEGRYHETGFVLTAEEEQHDYLEESLATVLQLAAGDTKSRLDVTKIKRLGSPAEIRAATGYDEIGGHHGYANLNSGWANAEASVAYALGRIRRDGGERVTIRSDAHVEQLVVSDGKCHGVALTGGEAIRADLVILAAGAWTPSLIDLHGRCFATGQAMAYVEITEQEQRDMRDRPVVMNMTKGMFIIPPRGRELKIARHGFGYQRPVKIPKTKLCPGRANEGDEVVEVSVPQTGVSIPIEAQEALRDALRAMVPHLADRLFTRTRICWYCDTPTGDFLICHHPDYASLFIATGGSGHGFKFFPVIGDKIIQAIEGNLEPELAQRWRWRDKEEIIQAAGLDGFAGCDDGSRAGRRGMSLEEEMRRTTA